MSDPPSHALCAGSVILWRDVCLRGTGFPSRMVLGTAASGCVRLIDAALEHERRGAPIAESRDALQVAFDEDRQRIGEFLREVARTPRFREAVLWQNRTVVHTGIEPLLRRPASVATSRARQYEQLVANYLQRYCVKNDTIGFFGPVGWATLDDQLASLRVAPGSTLVDRRTVYFEHWAIDALAARLSEDRALQITLAPRLMPTVWLEGELLHHPIDCVTRLPVATARLLQACSGERPACDIAGELASDPTLELDSVDEVYELLDELVEARFVLWCLEVPTAGFHPERALRAALVATSESPARQAAEAALAELEAARNRVAAAAGDPLALDGALVALDETFVRLTGRDASRNAGQTYAGRGIVFEDCRRNIEVVLGRQFLDRIGPPLALIQASARWFAHTVAARFRRVFEQLYRTLAAELGSADVDLILYYCELRAHLTGQAGARSATVVEVRNELQSRWAAILALPRGARRVELRVADLAPRVQAAFAAPGPGWPSARHQSPDLMIAAAGADALARGDFLVVLGELHACISAVTVPTLAKEHADPVRLHKARQADVGRSIAQVEPRANTNRGSTYTLTDGDLDVELGDTRSPRPREHVFDVAGFVVTERDGRLWVRRRDGSQQFDLLAFFEGDLTAESYIFDILGAAAHRPRVTLDGFVLAREQWRFEAADLPFARLTVQLDRFIAARRWAAEHQIPRFTFIKAPGEPKPIYLDLDSPVFVDIFCKLARAGNTVTVTEMLPTFDQLWLVDADGAAYCAELRTVMLDDQAWVPP
jgi:hypothetical protein